MSVSPFDVDQSGDDANPFCGPEQTLNGGPSTRYAEGVATFVVALVLAVLALIEAVSESATASGLRGLVTLSPTRPVCIEELPCSKPAAGVVLVFRRDGGSVTRVTTRPDGTYRVLLRPGRYTVVAPRYRFGSGIAPHEVRVPRGRVAHLDFEIDTGIQ